MISQVLIVLQAFLTVTLASWMLGGNIYWAPPWIIFSCFLSLLPLGVRFLEAPKETGRAVLRAWPWLTLIVFLLISLANPSFVKVVENEQILYREIDSIGWLPSVITAGIAREPLFLLIGFLIQGLAVYIVLHQRQAIRILFTLILLNSVLLALTGAYFDLRGAREILGHFVPPVRQYFFSTFIYHNHWSAFAILSIGVAAGLFFFSLRKKEILDLRGSPAIFFVACLALLALTIPMSTSRSGVVLLILLAIPFSFHYFYLLSRNKAGLGIRQEIAVPLCTVLFMVFIASFVMFNHFYLQQGWQKTESQLQQAEQAGAWQDFRLMAGADTFQMGLDRPVWGWGRGSFPYVFPQYQREEISFTKEGGRLVFEHAHNDWAEWFAELGLIGLTLLLLPFIYLSLIIFKDGHRSALGNWILGGNAVIVLYALVEFPFGNPAVCILFFILSAGAARYLLLPRERRSKSTEIPEII